MDLGPGSPGVVRLKHETHGVERHANLTLFFREDEYLVKSNSKCNGLLLLVFDGWLMSKNRKDIFSAFFRREDALTTIEVFPWVAKGLYKVFNV